MLLWESRKLHHLLFPFSQAIKYMKKQHEILLLVAHCVVGHSLGFGFLGLGFWVWPELKCTGMVQILFFFPNKIKIWDWHNIIHQWHNLEETTCYLFVKHPQTTKTRTLLAFGDFKLPYDLFIPFVEDVTPKKRAF